MTNTTQERYPSMMTVQEVADLLRLNDCTVRRYVKQGALEAVILPHKSKRQGYRIRRETVEKLLGKSLS